MSVITPSKIDSFIKAISSKSSHFVHGLEMEIEAIQPSIKKIHIATIEIFGEAGRSVAGKPCISIASRKFEMILPSFKDSNLMEFKQQVLETITRTTHQAIIESTLNRLCIGSPLCSLKITCCIQLDLDAEKKSSVYICRSIGHQS